MSERKLRVLMCVTGSVAVVRTMQIVEALLAQNYDVKVVMTSSSGYFWKDEWDEQLNELGVEVFTDQDEWSGKEYTRDMPVAHIELREWADMALIAPLTANTLAKIANGMADNLVTCIMRAWNFMKPVMVAPAMNTHMWEHPVTMEQLKKLRDWYHYLDMVDPVEKKLACGDVGRGGIADTDTIISRITIYEKIVNNSNVAFKVLY